MHGHLTPCQRTRADSLLAIPPFVPDVVRCQGYETNRTINLTVTTASPSSLRYVQNFGAGDVVVSAIWPRAATMHRPFLWSCLPADRDLCNDAE